MPSRKKPSAKKISEHFKNFTEEQIIFQIKSMLMNGNLSNILFIEMTNEILLRADLVKILLKIINFFWTLDMKDVESLIYIIVNSLTEIDKASSYLLFDHIKTMIATENLLQKSLLSIIPTMVGNIRLEDYWFTGFIDISMINDRFDNIISLTEVMRQMNTLSGTEKALLIKQLLNLLNIVNLEQCPKFVNEILLLCDHTNFQYCIGAVVNFFNQKPISGSQLSQSSITIDSQKLIHIQTAVLNHCYEIGRTNSEFAKEILKLCKNNNVLYSISGFMCIILLNLAGLEFIRDQILSFLVQCITTCYMETKLVVESGFIREAVIDNFNMDSLLMNAVKYCCVSEREFISINLLELGFMLINSGLPRSKVISLKGNKSKKPKDDTLINKMCNNDLNMSTPQKVGQAGIQMIIHLFKRLVPYRKAILEDIQNFLLKQSHKSSVFVYLELFADLISLMPMEIFEYIDQAKGQPIFELLCHFPEEVALGLVNALLPLIRYSSSIRNKLISVLMAHILSRRYHARMICVKSSLILLKYLRVTVDQFGSDQNTDLDNENTSSNNAGNRVELLTQCSQFACTQIAAQSKPLAVDNFANDEICSQILQVIDESCHQHPDTKVLIFRGLVQVCERNFYLSGQVVLFLLRKLRFFMKTSNQDDNERNDDGTTFKKNPFILSKLLLETKSDDGSGIPNNEKHQSVSTVTVEQIAGLVSCLAESVRYCKKNMPPRDILSNTIQENRLISEAVAKAESTIGEILSFLVNCEDVLELEMTSDSRSDISGCSPTTSVTSLNNSTKQMIMNQFIDLYDILLVHFICCYDNKNDNLDKSQSVENIEKLLERKEQMLRNNSSDVHRSPVNKKQKKIVEDENDSNSKNDGNDFSTVLSLSTLQKSIRYIFESLVIDLESANARFDSSKGRGASGNQRPKTVMQKTKKRNRHQTGSTNLELSLDASRIHNVVVDDNNGEGTQLNNDENGNLDRLEDNDPDNNNSTNHNNDNAERIAQSLSSAGSFVKEKIAIYLLNRLIILVKKIGSAQYRISHRNRQETCTILTDLTTISLNFYIKFLCFEINVVDDWLRCSSPSSSSKFHCQIQQLCLVLYCSSFNKIIQFCSKTIDSFLSQWSLAMKDHLKSLQKSLGLSTSTDGEKERRNDELIFESSPPPPPPPEETQQQQQPIVLSSFVKLHKLIVSRVLVLSQRKLYHDIDSLLTLTTDIAIYCGIDSARQALITSDAPGPSQSTAFNGFGARAAASSYRNRRININWLNNLNVWAYNLLKSAKLHFKSSTGREAVIHDIGRLYDTQMCQCLVGMCLTTGRIVKPDFVNFLERFISDISTKIGSYSTILVGSGNQDNKGSKVAPFEFIVHPMDLLTEIINAISLALDDGDWLLMKWKCGWQEFEQRKAINNSQLSHASCTPSEFVETSLTTVTDQDRHIFEQIFGLCSIMTKMISCSITNVTRLYSLVKLCTRLFDQLTSITKQYISLTRSKLGGCSNQFEKLVKISGGSLSPLASQFIVYIQKVESICRTNSKNDKKKSNEDEEENQEVSLTNEKIGDKKSKNTENRLDKQLGRTEKDMKLIPNFVLSIEQYQRYLIELQKVAKINLMVHVRTLNSRDFRIDLERLQDSLDKNATVYMSDDDVDGEENEEVEEEEEGAEVAARNRSNSENEIGGDCNVDEDSETTVTNEAESEAAKGSRVGAYGSPPKKKQRI